MFYLEFEISIKLNSSKILPKPLSILIFNMINLLYADWGNPPYKGCWLEIGWARRGGMKTNTQKYELTLRWTNPTLFTHWMEWRGCPSNFNLRSRVVLDTQVWLQTRDEDERSHLLAEALCLIPDETAEQRPWEGLERRTDIRNNQEWNQRGLSERVLPSHFSHALTTWSTCLWDPYPMMATSFNLIPWIITFDYQN